MEPVQRIYIVTGFGCNVAFEDLGQAEVFVELMGDEYDLKSVDLLDLHLAHEMIEELRESRR